MGLVLTVLFKVREDKADAFEKLVTNLFRQVLQNEPSARMYQLCRAQNDPLTYRLIEIYDSQEALTAHGQSDHYKAAAPDFAPCLAEKPQLEKLDLI